MASAADIRPGEYFKLKNDIFRVIRKGLIAVGTHSHTKVTLTVQNFNGGGEKQQVYSHEDKLDTVDVKRTKAQVVLVNTTSLQVMDLYSYETVEATADPELIADLKEGDTVTLVEMEGRFTVTDKLKNAY
jgi:translation elongation factor P/translation initiation factor 5A